ncbi:hypothetical protein [Brasilonema sp. UFV-L1]|uniref:hypothetical protein n=1 Tax=Brasilonema sp. UFV-L1 TaxID=2234130 RepID=UPI00145C9039|nr:hypothetical protein [Brasilonema sp. UFV-L1]NMG11764.1 hypothetical protein [Brasilonema sp. UFV-L1]
MKIRQLLAVFAMPLVIGAGVLVNTNHTTANQPDLVAQDSSQPSGEQKPPKGKRRRPNFAAAAQKLGVTEAQLKEALGVPTQPPPPNQSSEGRPRRRLDIKGAATKLGVTEEQLKEALGIPPRPPEKPSTGQ